MVEIQSKEVIDKMSDELKVQPALLLPRELGKMIVPVFEVGGTKKINIESNHGTDTTSTIIATTHPTKETWLVGASLSVTKDIVNDSIWTGLNVIPQAKGVLDILMRLRYEPLTAGNFFETVTFPFPILLSKGSAISVTSSAATASIDTTGIIYYYETDPQ